MHVDLAIHHDAELVVRCREPRRRTFRPQRFDHVLEVLADHDLLVRRGMARNFEHIRHCVVLGLARDDFDGAFTVVVETPQPGLLHVCLLESALILSATSCVVLRYSMDERVSAGRRNSNDPRFGKSERWVRAEDPREITWRPRSGLRGGPCGPCGAHWSASSSPTLFVSSSSGAMPSALSHCGSRR